MEGGERMRLFGSFIGSFLYGVVVLNVWGKMAGTYGVIGGWIAGLIIVALGWFINHLLGVIDNRPGAIGVDQGWGVAIGGVASGMFLGQPLSAAIPTIVISSLGGILGGIVSGLLAKQISEDEKASA